MRKRGVLLSVLGAASVLCLAAGLASANALSISNRQIRASWERVEFIAEQGFGGLYGNNCQITLEGSFHSSTLRKIIGALVGYLTRASVGTCEIREIVVTALDLPWHVRYRGYTGTLPTITGLAIEVVGMSWEFFVAGALRCLHRTTALNPAVGTIAVRAGVLGGLTWNEARRIPRAETFQCPYASELWMRGTSRPVTLLGTSTAVTVRLI